MAITNLEELKKALAPQLQIAVDHTMNEVLKENKSKIEDIVYGGYDPQYYQRTGEFKDGAWETNQEGEGDAKGSFEYYPNGIHKTQEEPWHVSVVDGTSFAEYLADSLYKGNSGGIFGNGEWNRPRNAFKQLDNWLSNSTLRKLFEAGLNQSGLVWKRSTGGLTKTQHDTL